MLCRDHRVELRVVLAILTQSWKLPTLSCVYAARCLLCLADPLQEYLYGLNVPAYICGLNSERPQICDTFQLSSWLSYTDQLLLIQHNYHLIGIHNASSSI